MERQSLKSHLAPGSQGRLPGRPLSLLISQEALPNGNLRKTLKKPDRMILSMKKKKTRRKRDVELHPENQLLDHCLQKNRKE
uniref:DNA methyltransferase 1 n=1 Tax=Rousettus aegyptiacus TaxID=9407 RepID=A0A7J8BQ20_ROUAE|nr:DNA methyltransferase 1 [Rousettus aegyptiacus]